MKEIRLLSIAMRNFKGAKSELYTFDGKNVKIFGDNEAGKTTVFDAFTWCLFGKNSNDETDFDIKTLDENNVSTPELEHEVTVVLSINGIVNTLQRTYKEKWVKPHGKKEKELQGHTTTFVINEVPHKKKEYTKAIEEIIEEDSFKLLTNALYFNEKLDWKTRRELLFEMAGAESEEVILSVVDELGPLLERLSGKSVQEFKAIINSKKTTIKKKLDQFEPRFDEIDRDMPEKPEQSLEEIENLLAFGRQEKQELQERINDITARNKQIDSQMAQIRAERSKLASIESTISKESRAEHDQEMARRSVVQRKLNKLISDKESFLSIIQTKESEIERRTKVKSDLIKEYKAIKALSFEAPVDDGTNFTCGQCGQQLPSDQIEKQIEQQKTRFMNNKKSRFEANVSAGKSENAAIEKLSKDKEDCTQSVEKLNAEIQTIETEITSWPEIKPGVVDYESNQRWIDQNDKIKQIEKNIEKPVSSTDIVGMMKTVDKRIEDLNGVKAIHDRITWKNERKQELEKEQQALNTELMKLEESEYLIERFEVIQVERIESKVNSMFTNVSFKLFEKQLNGGLKSTCEALVPNKKGTALVPYSSANSAGKINGGLDIMNALMNHFGVKAPVFIDNNESVTELAFVATQVIGLFVEAGTDQLRLEVE